MPDVKEFVDIDFCAAVRCRTSCKGEGPMKLKFVFLAFVFCVIATAAHAQSGGVTSGCGESPENPTAILALVGSAGGFLVAARNRFFRK